MPRLRDGGRVDAGSLKLCIGARGGGLRTLRVIGHRKLGITEFPAALGRGRNTVFQKSLEGLFQALSGSFVKACQPVDGGVGAQIAPGGEFPVDHRRHLKGHFQPQ